MLARIYTAVTLGLDPVKIEVEVDGVRGKPMLVIIGLPSKSVDESKERITAALQHCGFSIRAKHTIVNLAPADLKKQGSTFELAIAIGMLKMYGDITADTDQAMFFGELSLDGSIKPIRGALPLVLAAKKMGFSTVFIPEENVAEVSIIGDITIYAAHHLQQVINHLTNRALINPIVPVLFSELPSTAHPISFHDVIGQDQAKRALLIAAAGGHNILLTGPPGSGKSLLAKALNSILPPLSLHESLVVTSIYSISGKANSSLVTTRPFRAPHHTISEVGLIGGGTHLKPGEISLAHHGVLFLDELPEFPRSVIESLRQPLEDGVVTVSRAAGSVTYPSQCMLVGAANPCPCGWHNTGQKSCSCTQFQIDTYQRRISGPMLDRIDLHLHVKAVPPESFAKKRDSHIEVNELEIVQRTRKIQQQRYQNYPDMLNAHLLSKQVLQWCEIEPKALMLLQQAMNQLELSARSYFKLLKVARTIADLATVQTVNETHVGEALQYRQV